MTLVHYRIDDQTADIFIKPLSEVKYIKFCTFLWLQEATIRGDVEM